MSYSLSDLIRLVVEENGEAIHLHDGGAPVIEVRRKLHRIEGPPLDAGDTQVMLRAIAPPAEFRQAMHGCAAFEHHYSGTIHFQLMAFLENGSLRLELRRIEGKTPASTLILHIRRQRIPVPFQP